MSRIDRDEREYDESDDHRDEENEDIDGEEEAGQWPED